MAIASSSKLMPDIHLDNVLLSFDPDMTTVQDIHERDGIVLDLTDEDFYEYKPENCNIRFQKQPSETVRVQVSQAIS